MLREIQWREDFLNCATRNREPSVGTSITCCESLAKVIGGLLAWDTQLHRKKCAILLLWCKWLQSHLCIHFIRFHICMHCDIVKLVDQLQWQAQIIGYVPIDLFVSCGSNLLTMTLRKVNHMAPNGRQGHKRATYPWMGKLHMQELHAREAIFKLMAPKFEVNSRALTHQAMQLPQLNDHWSQSNKLNWKHEQIVSCLKLVEFELLGSLKVTPSISVQSSSFHGMVVLQIPSKHVDVFHKIQWCHIFKVTTFFFLEKKKINQCVVEVQSGSLILILVVRGGYFSQNLVVQKFVHGGAF